MNEDRVTMIVTHAVGLVAFILVAAVADESARWWIAAARFDGATSIGLVPVDQARFWTLLTGLLVASAGAGTLGWRLRDSRTIRARSASFTAIASLLAAIIAMTAALVAVQTAVVTVGAHATHLPYIGVPA